MVRLDSYHRPIDYLRVSVTDRCNMRCVYCMPEGGVRSRAHGDILRFEEIELVVRAAALLGICQVRLTGGEPLARLGVVDLVRMLAQVPGIDDLSMTTNGTLLARHAEELREAGLHRVNVSLDTLRPDRYQAITRRGQLHEALDGIDAAHRAGLEPVKINAVIIRDLNDDEVVDLARLTVTRGWHVRFIEWMPLGDDAQMASAWHGRTVTAAEMREQVTAALGPLEPASPEVGAGPSRYYCLPGASGTLGFITPLSEHFCGQCNRLRLTADGQLRPCLLSSYEIDLRTPLRKGAGVSEIVSLLARGIDEKPARHHLDECDQVKDRAMSQIGG